MAVHRPPPRVPFPLKGGFFIQVNGSDQIISDVITYVGKLATVNHDLGDLESEELQQVIEVLNTGLSKDEQRRLRLWDSEST